MRRFTSLIEAMLPNSQRFLAFLALSLASLTLGPAAVSAETYGRLIVRHNAAPAAMLETSFAHVHTARSFLLVVSESSREPLSFSWSVHCTGPANRESGGISGRVTIANGHWVKRVRADWIKHPASCSGRIDGTTAGSPVLVRVFAA